MQKRKAAPSPEETNQLEDQALLIAGEIFNLINQYTHDSSVSKFFLTDEIARACYGLSGGFASVIYTPALEPDELKETTILSFIYALMTYGFNIYLRERSLTTNAAPYSLPFERSIIKKAQKRTLTITSRGTLVSTPLADKIISILVQNVKNQINMEEMKLPKHRLNKKKFLDYTKLSLYWGYNFAKEILADSSGKTSSKKTILGSKAVEK